MIVLVYRRILRIWRLWVLVVPIAIVSCASLEDVPQEAGDVDFSAPDGFLHKSAFEAYGYQVTYEFPPSKEIDLDLAFRATQAGILYAGFDVVKVDMEQFFVIAHRGSDLYYNIEYVGMYLKQDEAGIRAKILASGDPLAQWYTKEIDRIIESIKTGTTQFIKAEMRQRGLD